MLDQLNVVVAVELVPLDKLQIMELALEQVVLA
jgi:hypothetical protein